MFKFILSMTLSLFSFQIFSAPFISGQDYEEIPAANRIVFKHDRIHVTEFFSYGCPWCARLEAPLNAWIAKQGKSIYFSRVPVVFNPNWEYYAKAYYMIESFSLNKAAHDQLFKAIVLDKQPLNSPEAMVEFFKKNGIEPKVTQSAFANSPSMAIKLQADKEAMVKFQINGIPTLVVNDLYKTNLKMAKSEARLFEILDYLVAKSKEEK